MKFKALSLVKRNGFVLVLMQKARVFKSEISMPFGKSPGNVLVFLPKLSKVVSGIVVVFLFQSVFHFEITFFIFQN